MDESQLRKLQESQREQQEVAQLQSEIAQLETIVKPALDRDALSRLSNIKASDAKQWLQMLVVLAQLLQQGKLKTPVDDEAMKKLLLTMSPKKRETKITFSHR